MNTSRRHFFAVAGTASILGSTLAQGALANDVKESTTSQSLFSSNVILQNPTENSIQVVWTLNAPATGWVEWGTAEDNLDQKACGAIFGLKPYSDRVISIPISGLKPNTTYFYRAVCAAVDFRGAYNIHTSNEPEYSPIRSFTTPGADANNASFAVINDTHQVRDIMAAEFEKIAELKPSFTIWNGDTVHSIEGHDMLVKSVMNPTGKAFADDHPLLFCRGNHDTRGHWARFYPEYLTPWTQEKAEFAGLGYSFVVRQGDLAIIGLDTGEDKPDFRREWAGLAEFEPYIELQGKWLRDVLASEKVKTAKYVVAFCHIPLFDDNPKANPGTLEYGYSSWKKLGADFWGGALQDAGVQLVVAAHIHRHTVKKPTPDRCWTQITGGGCSPKDATVIHGNVADGKLTINVYSIATGEILSTLDIAPRF